ncbi:hypothetical protein ACD661_12025 [Legionella lytica]|uniref:Transmembrane protein n=1 Tax=Legionella lytica TaxID=96232 RepID=A0ABW8D995_9GAMM
MKNTFLWRGTLAGASMFLLSTAYAGIPLWSFEALTSTNFPLGPTDTATVQYTVYNQSQRAKTLVLHSSLTPGVQQTSPCILAPKSQQGTCLLTLKVSGNALPANGIHGGPVLCQANADGSPNPNQCYRPSPASALNIQKVNTPVLASLAVSSNALQLQTFGSAQTITITNLSTNITATNVNALFIGTPLAGAVTASTCTSIAPQGSCTMTFTPTRIAVAPSMFTIQGANTSVVSTQLNVRESYVYVTKADGVARCIIDDNAAPGNCEQMTGEFNLPQGIAFNKTKTLAYVVNYATSDDTPVVKCTIDSEGKFDTCSSAWNSSTQGLGGIALSTDGSKAYITQIAGGSGTTIWNCEVADDGNLNCNGQAISASYSPNGITLNKNNTLSYVATLGLSGNDQIGLCPIINGSLNSCEGTPPTSSGSTPFLGAHNIALNNQETIAYVTNTGYDVHTDPTNPGFISVCSINSGGAFSVCNSIADPYTPVSGLINPTGLALTVNGAYAYIADFDANILVRCQVGNNTLTNCLSSSQVEGSGLVYLALG